MKSFFENLIGKDINFTIEFKSVSRMQENDKGLTGYWELPVSSYVLKRKTDEAIDDEGVIIDEMQCFLLWDLFSWALVKSLAINLIRRLITSTTKDFFPRY